MITEIKQVNNKPTGINKTDIKYLECGNTIKNELLVVIKEKMNLKNQRLCITNKKCNKFCSN